MKPKPHFPAAASLPLALLALSCESGGTSGSASQPQPTEKVELPAPNAKAPASSGRSGVETFGAAFQPGPEVPLSTLLSKPNEHAGKVVTTRGQVQKACSRKGCWMEIGNEAGGCRVTFQDYGFFVPKDSAGATARVQGTLQTRTVDAADVRHLESEGASFQKRNADGTATELHLVATAVELER